MLSVAVTLGLLAAVLSAPVASAASGDVERVSVATSGAQGDGDSTAPSISHTGDIVAFQSRASTLVGGDGNGGLDVFTRRRAGQHTERVSSVPGVSAGSTRPAVSADGSSVAFESFAPELGAGVFGDIFLRRGGGAIARLTAPTGNGDNVAGLRAVDLRGREHGRLPVGEPAADRRTTTTASPTSSPGAAARSGG